MIKKETFSSIKRFVIHCSLDNIKPLEGNVWSTHTIDFFMKHTSNKLITLHLKSKLEKIFNVDIYFNNMNLADQLCKDGIARLESNCLDQTVHQMEAHSTNDICTVDVDCIYSPYCFYVSLTKALPEFNLFQQKLQKFYEDETKNQQMSAVNPRVGAMYIAKYTEDNQWYRAIVKEIDVDQKNVHVFFVDYGNEDVLLMDGKSLMNITDGFKNFPRMALKCSLYGIEPFVESRSQTVEITDFMHSILNETVEAKFLGDQDDCHFVDLTISKPFEGLRNVKDILVQKKYAKPADLTKSPSRIKTQVAKRVLPNNGEERCVLTNRSSLANGESYVPKFKSYPHPEYVLEKNNKYELTVSCIETVFEFYVQETSCKEASSELSKLMREIQYFYERKINLPQPVFKEGNACVFHDFERKLWYRAQIENIIDNDHCIVSLVDFGYRRYINRTYLRDIPDKFLELSCQSALASLYDLITENPDRVEEQLHSRFKEIALQKSFYCKVMEINRFESANQNCVNKNKNKYLLNLFDANFESVFSMLVENVNASILEPSEKFKPKKISSLDETCQSILESNDADISIMNGTTAENRQFRITDISSKSQTNNYNDRGERKTIPEASIHDDPTSPFPLHGEQISNSKKRSYSSETENICPATKGQDQVDFSSKLVLRKDSGKINFIFKNSRNFLCFLGDVRKIFHEDNTHT